MSDEVLFIGGANDGRRIKVPLNVPLMRLPIPPKIGTSDVAHEPDMATKNIETYRLESIRTGNFCFPVYIHSELSVASAIARVLYFYRPPNQL